MCSSIERKVAGVCCVPVTTEGVAARLKVRRVPWHVPALQWLAEKRQVLCTSGQRWLLGDIEGGTCRGTCCGFNSWEGDIAGVCSSVGRSVRTCCGQAEPEGVVARLKVGHAPCLNSWGRSIAGVCSPAERSVRRCCLPAGTEGVVARLKVRRVPRHGP